VILGVGVDLVDVERMRRVLTRRWAHRFVRRVFTPEEIHACDNSPQLAQCYSARFAAKEAVAKAFGTGFSAGITPAMISVRGGERTRPEINLTDAALQFAQSRNVSAIHVSLTHVGPTACAFVVVEALQGRP
jgi:holo-[acyl-carrier protein] synthase